MKENLTELVYIIDRSGSMYYLTDDTIGGYNQMMEEQKKQKGDAVVTTVLFNDKTERIVDRKDIREVEKMSTNDYYTLGSTAMLDAIGTTIDYIGECLNNTPEEERPSKVIVTIITDGYENASTEYTGSQIKEMIERQQNEYSWTFVFIGANMDAIKVGTSIGINPKLSKNYTASKVGTESVYKGVSIATTCFRTQSCDCSLDTVNAMSDILDENLN